MLWSLQQQDDTINAGSLIINVINVDNHTLFDVDPSRFLLIEMPFSELRYQ